MKIPKPLIDDILDGRCLPFVGAGFSANASLPDEKRMPTWKELIAALRESTDADPALLGPDVASAFERRFGRVQLIEQVRKALYVDQATPGKAHLTFAHLPFDTVYTTNFDTLLEDTYRSLSFPYRALVGERQMPFHGGHKMSSIVKMHGDVRHEEYITITREDYDQYLERYPVIATHLSAMLITRTPFFIGYSLTDPNFLSIQEIVKSRLGNLVRMSYVVQFNTPDGEAELLLDRNIHVIALDGRTPREQSQAVNELLESIQRECDANTAQNLRTAEPALFENIDPIIIRDAVASSNPGLLLSGSSHFVFSIMPFKSTSSIVYREAIAPAVESAGLISLRREELPTTSSELETVRSAIQQARLCIADISDANPNVTFEVGLAVTFQKPLLLVARLESTTPIELADRQVIWYDVRDVARFREKLQRAIDTTLGAQRIDEARKLIAEGHYQAAIVVLGSYLEQVLWKRYADLHQAEPTFRRRHSLRYLVNQLAADAELPPELQSELLDAIAIRNEAVHNGRVPDANAAYFVLNVTEKAERWISSP